MKGYFTRKPLNGEEVKTAIREARRMHVGATEIEVLERVVLSLDEYLHFLDNLSRIESYISVPIIVFADSPLEGAEAFISKSDFKRDKLIQTIKELLHE